MTTARDELRALANKARDASNQCRELCDQYGQRADALFNIVENHTDATCATLLARLKKETPSVFPS